jgi:hypothetical protein
MTGVGGLRGLSALHASIHSHCLFAKKKYQGMALSGSLMTLVPGKQISWRFEAFLQFVLIAGNIVVAPRTCQPVCLVQNASSVWLHHFRQVRGRRQEWKGCLMLRDTLEWHAWATGGAKMSIEHIAFQSAFA